MISRTDLNTLINAAPEPGLSLFLPTWKHGRETRQNPIALKNALSDAQAQLAAQGILQPHIDALLAPAAALVGDHDFWQAQEMGLALFLADGQVQIHKLLVPVESRVVVADRFDIVPLLPMLDGDAPCVVLTVTADHSAARLATRYGMADFAVPDMPADVDALDLEPDYEGNVQSHGFGRPNSGGQNMPKTQVYGDSPEEWRKARLVDYARRVAAALAAHLARDPMPVVVIADAEMAGHLAKSPALGPMIAGHVDTNPASLDDEALHRAGWAVMQPARAALRDAALASLATRLGQGDGTATAHTAEVVAAAHQGRVEALFLAQGADLWGAFDAQTGKVTIAPPPSPASSASEQAPTGAPTGAGPEGAVDLIDLAARLTLRAGGELRVVDADHMPEGTPMAATLRY